jgi:hypothetical protein
MPKTNNASMWNPRLKVSSIHQSWYSVQSTILFTRPMLTFVAGCTEYCKRESQVASSLQLNETGKRPITRALNRRKLDTCRPNLERKARWDLAQAKKPCTQADPHFHPSCLAPCSAQYQMADGGWCCSWDGWKAARDQPTSSALRWRRAAPGLSPLCLCLCLCPDSIEVHVRSGFQVVPEQRNKTQTPPAQHRNRSFVCFLSLLAPVFPLSLAAVLSIVTLSVTKPGLVFALDHILVCL